MRRACDVTAAERPSVAAGGAYSEEEEGDRQDDGRGEPQETAARGAAARERAVVKARRRTLDERSKECRKRTSSRSCVPHCRPSTVRPAGARTVRHARGAPFAVGRRMFSRTDYAPNPLVRDRTVTFLGIPSRTDRLFAEPATPSLDAPSASFELRQERDSGSRAVPAMAWVSNSLLWASHSLLGGKVGAAGRVHLSRWRRVPLAGGMLGTPLLLAVVIAGCAGGGSPRDGHSDAARDDGGAEACTSTVEACDGTMDEDCDGVVDEGCACVDGRTRACGSDVGACSAGLETCAGGAWGACTGAEGAGDEACDGHSDEDCDGAVDERCACVDGSSRSCGTDTGSCVAGTEMCVDGAWGACRGRTGPAEEACDGLSDEDCDGVVDEGCACASGATRSCGSDVGRCVPGVQSCAAGAWSACVGATTAEAERCDGVLDENCNGVVDEGCACTDGASRSCGSDVGVCVAGAQVCDGGAWGACMGAVGPRTEVCDGTLDEDCDGTPDEGCARPVFDVAAATRLGLPADASYVYAHGIAFSDDGAVLAIGDMDAGPSEYGAVYLHRWTTSGPEAAPFQVLRGTPDRDDFGFSLAFMPDTHVLAVGDYGASPTHPQSVHLIAPAFGGGWSDTPYQAIHAIPESIAFTPDGRSLVVGANGVSLQLRVFARLTGVAFDPESVQDISIESGHSHGWGGSLARGPSGGLLAGNPGTGPNTVAWFPVVDGRVILPATWSLAGPTRMGRFGQGIALSPDGRTLALADPGNREVLLYEYPDAIVPYQIIDACGAVACSWLPLAFAPDGTSLVVGTNRGVLVFPRVAP